MERYTIVFLVFSICLVPCFSSQDYPIDSIHKVSARSASPQCGGGWNNNDDFNRDATNTANTVAHAATFTADMLTSPFRLAGLAANSDVHGASKITASGQFGIFGGSNDGVKRGATDAVDLTQNAAGHAVTFVSNIFTAPFKLAGAAATAAHGTVTHSGRGTGGQSVISSTQNSGLAGKNADFNSDAANAANTAAHAATFTANMLTSPFRLAGPAANSAAYGATTNTGQSASGQYNGLTINNNGASRGAANAADLTNLGVGHSGNVVYNTVGAPLNHPGAGAAVESAAHNNAVNGVGDASGQSGFYDSKSQQSSSFGGQSSGSGEQFSTNSVSGRDYGTTEFQGVGGNTARFNQKFSKSDSFKESHYSYQSNNDGGSSFGSQSLGSVQAYGGGNEQQREQQSGLGHGAARHEVDSLNERVLSTGNGQLQQGLSHGVGTSSNGTGVTFGVAPSGLGYQRPGVAPNALAGALNLASLGLISASQTRCSTCGLGGYALSNAKSTDGDAVALSIGI